MSDRILVLHEGRVTAEISRAEATQERVMFAATGNLAADEVATSRSPPRARRPVAELPVAPTMEARPARSGGSWRSAASGS